jgi:hypothetical protein
MVASTKRAGCFGSYPRADGFSFKQVEPIEAIFHQVQYGSADRSLPEVVLKDRVP